MVGIDKVKEFFGGFNANYVIIAGRHTPCTYQYGRG
jgi:hypothetical protein